MESKGISKVTTWAMAVGCAITVANLYYLQPLAAQIAKDFNVPQGQIGAVGTLAQIGYALGMLLIVPLGDMLERRSLVMASLVITLIAQVLMAFAGSVPLLAVTSFLLGLATVTPQLLVPFAAGLSRPEERGRVVGLVMGGLLIGILLGRTFSGFLGAHWGWRAVYVVAGGLTIAVGIFLRSLLPKSAPDPNGLTYPSLMRSVLRLAKEEPVLRESAIYGAVCFGAFSAFWTTLAFLLAGPPTNYGADKIGLFGLVGAAGALAAPIAGRMADRGGPRRTILISLGLVMASFAVFALRSVPAIILGVVLMDVGTQAGHISNQSRIYAIRPESRNRMNTVYMTAYFVGGASGSGLGTWAWTRFGWAGVCAVGAILAVAGLSEFKMTSPRARA